MGTDSCDDCTENVSSKLATESIAVVKEDGHASLKSEESSSLRGLHAHFDCFSGAAGDMMLAACVDAVSNDHDHLEASRELLERIGEHLRKGLPELADEFELQVERVWRGSGSIAALHVTVRSIYKHVAAPVPEPARDEMDNVSESTTNYTPITTSIHQHYTMEPQHTSHSHDTSHSHEHDHDHEHKHEHSKEYEHETHSSPNAVSLHEVLESTQTHSIRQHSHHHQHGDRTLHNSKIRNLPVIRRMLEDAPVEYIPHWVRHYALAAFTELALAEAMVHGAASVDAVHFHEVGAVDSIVDTVGTLLALYFLNVKTVSCSRLPLGEGTVMTAHGLLPVPAPATLYLLRDMPVTAGPPGATGELVTPTGAALLRALTHKIENIVTNDGKLEYGRLPPRMTLRRIGVGAGTKNFTNHPNIIRLMLCDSL